MMAGLPACRPQATLAEVRNGKSAASSIPSPRSAFRSMLMLHLAAPPAPRPAQRPLAQLAQRATRRGLHDFPARDATRPVARDEPRGQRGERKVPRKLYDTLRAQEVP